MQQRHQPPLLLLQGAIARQHLGVFGTCKTCKDWKRSKQVQLLKQMH